MDRYGTGATCSSYAQFCDTPESSLQQKRTDTLFCCIQTCPPENLQITDAVTQTLKRPKNDDHQDFNFIEADLDSDPNRWFVKMSRVFDTGDNEDYVLCWDCKMTLIWSVNKIPAKYPPTAFGGLGIVVTNSPTEEVTIIRKNTGRRIHKWVMYSCWCLLADLSLIIIRYFK